MCEFIRWPCECVGKIRQSNSEPAELSERRAYGTTAFGLHSREFKDLLATLRGTLFNKIVTIYFSSFLTSFLLSISGKCPVFCNGYMVTTE
jgi:hypothetical protein